MGQAAHVVHIQLAHQSRQRPSVEHLVHRGEVADPSHRIQTDVLRVEVRHRIGGDRANPALVVCGGTCAVGW